MTKTARVDADSMRVVPPGLHARQLEVLHDPARFKMLRAGRRWRKSGLGVVQAFTGYGDAFKGALTGGQIGFWVPSMTKRYLVADWEPMRALARQIPGSRIEEADHRVVMPNGGWVMMLTGDTIDSGRGLGLDGAVIDEASLMAEALWTETIRSTLLDRIGWAMFLFTPKGLNWLHALEQANAARRDWSAFHFRSHDNPELLEEEIEAMAQDMSSLVYRQEILAEYVSHGAGMFHRAWFRYWHADGPFYVLGDTANRVSIDACRRFCTVDLAWSLEESADYTVIATWAVTPHNHLVLVDCVRERLEGPDIVSTMRGVYERHRPGLFIVERATRQLSIIQEADRAGLPIREVRAEKDKVARALPATARVERGAVWFPAAQPWTGELEAELLAFPAGRHDDFVDCLSYACIHLPQTAGARVVGF